jgi:glucose/arabinose dehydrogenase
MRSAVFNPALLLGAALVACSGGPNAPNNTAASSVNRPSVSRNVCGASTTVATGGQSPAASGLQVPPGFAIETIAAIHKARELAALPNGDLLVGTTGSEIYIVPNAEGQPGAPQVFATIKDNKAAGVEFAQARCEIFVGSENHVWAIPYHGERKAPQIVRIADVRTGQIAPGSDGDVHTTTSVAYAEGLVYAAVGSSCDARMDHGKKPCTEVDPTRAAVSVMNPDGSNFIQRAKRIRNAIAVARNPKSGSVWVGGAGQDHLPFGHPYEYLDDLSAHPGDADYGWPECEENHHVYVRGADCSKTVEPLVELPAYSTIIGAAFYPIHLVGAYEFPSSYRGGLFATAHGSWHTKNGCFAEPPHVVFVAMTGDTPSKPVDWTNPTTQWTDFVTGFETGCLTRIGRPTGITVGPQGSLFIGDGDAGLVFRVRPTH